MNTSFTRTLLFAVVAVVSSGSVNAQCRTTTAFLDSKLPHWTDPSLRDMRKKAISEDIMVAMRKVNQDRIPPNIAVDVTLEQAKKYDDSIKKDLKTVMDVDSLGTTDEQFLERLQNGPLDVKSCDGLRNGYLCIAIVNKMAAVVMRSIAAEMQCHIRAGSWPK